MIRVNCPQTGIGHRVCLVLLALGMVCAGGIPVFARDALPSSAAPVHPAAHPARVGFHHSPVDHAALWPIDGALEWPVLDTESLIKEDEVLDDLPGVPMRIGVNRPSPTGPITPQTHGQWIQLDETRLWRLVLHARGAEAVRVHFQQFNLDGESVLVMADHRERLIENYRARGLTDEGTFWSVAIPGPRVCLELRCPAGADDPELIIDEISHLYRQGRGAPGEANEEEPQGTSGLLYCQEDVTCHTVDPNAKDAVGRMLYTVSGSTYLCSGALLNDTDPNTTAGYFLTAHHCVNTQSAANSLTVYWFYETDTCNGTAPYLFTLPRSDGGTLLATANQTDFTFIRLANDPADGQGLADWSTLPPEGTVHGIHHPGGSYKRYSQGHLTTEEPTCSERPPSEYHYLDWTIGITEGGSSGSPLFNENWEVVGQLYGICRFANTTPGCDNPQDFNTIYGKFATSYASSDMSVYLNLITPDDPYEDNDDINSAPLLPAGQHELILVDFDDYFSFHVHANTTATVSASFNTADMNLDLQLLTTDGTLLDASTSLYQSTETVSAYVGPGTYIIRAYKVSKWGGPYTLTIDPGAIKPAADYDDDGDVDMIDFALLQRCLSGEGVPAVSPDCDGVSLDGDNDVDAADMAIFFNCFSGPDIPAAVDCALPW